MLAPLAASLLRYGACLLPITLERCLFSKITTTIWSGRGTAAFSFLGAGGLPGACIFSGLGSAAGWGVGSARAFGVGRTPAFGRGSSMAWVFVGSVGTTVGRPLEGAGAAVDDGSATAQAADTKSNIPAAAQPNLGKTRPCT